MKNFLLNFILIGRLPTILNGRKGMTPVLVLFELTMKIISDVSQNILIIVISQLLRTMENCQTAVKADCNSTTSDESPRLNVKTKQHDITVMDNVIFSF